MNYVITILKKYITEHKIQISKLENIEIELPSSQFFADAETEERSEYIKQLEKAIQTLHNSNT